MSYLRSEHAPLHTLLACVLWDEKYRGRFVSFNTGKSICDVMAPDDYITGQNYLSTALKCGDDAIDWPVFGSLSPEEKTAIEYRDGVKLVIRKNLRFGKNGRASVVGCFGPDHAIPELRGSHELMAFAAGGERSSVRGEYNIPSAVMDKYNEYARSRFKRINESLPPRARPRPKSANTSSAAAKRTRPNTADAPPAPLDKEAEIVKLKSDLESEMLQRRQIDASIVATVSRLKALGDGGGDPTADRVEKMYYILGDCAGEIDVNTDRDVILLSELLDGLIIEDDETAGINGDNRNDGQEDELGAESDDEADDGSVNSTTVDHAGMDNTTTQQDDENEDPVTDQPTSMPTKPKRREFVYNKRYNCWVPKWVVAVNASDYGRLKKEAISVRAFKALFRRKKTRFPPKAKSIITASTIPAAGASDFGVQSVIFGTTKAIAEVMGIKLSHEQLSKAIPSVKTLRNWEFDLAGGCVASVIDQIAKDSLRVKQETGNPLQISLITDHGNRDGMDHLQLVVAVHLLNRAQPCLLLLALENRTGGGTVALRTLPVCPTGLAVHAGQASAAVLSDGALAAILPRPNAGRGRLGSCGGTRLETKVSIRNSIPFAILLVLLTWLEASPAHFRPTTTATVAVVGPEVIPTRITVNISRLPGSVIFSGLSSAPRGKESGHVGVVRLGSGPELG
eukprot:scaffold57319_cov35-Cyclotella_meneghiniana.AAC.1